MLHRATITVNDGGGGYSTVVRPTPSNPKGAIVRVLYKSNGRGFDMVINILITASRISRYNMDAPSFDLWTELQSTSAQVL